MTVRQIEWPSGSGHVASYSPSEQRIMREIADSDASTAGRELAFLAEAKSRFDATLREPR